MTCEGCSGAVKRILSKLDGVSTVVTDVGAKTVVVESEEGGSTDAQAMLAALTKWGTAAGKSVELVQ